MPWRYQPVIVTDAAPHDEKYLSICEVYFDQGGHALKAWGEPRQWPAGEDIGGLQRDLVRMLVDSYSWVPVPYETLKAGMTFEKALTTEERDGIARMVESVSFASKPKIQ